jgi:hypothetical protein
MAVNSTLEIDAYLLDTLMPDLVGHDRQPAAFLVYVYVWRRTRGEGRTEVAMSLREIAEGTGLSKRAVQTALGSLVRRRLIGVERESITAVARYTVHRPWAGD